MRLLDGPPAPWQPGVPGARRLGTGEVHLWLLSLDEPPYPMSRLAALLQQDEHERAARFHFERDRRRFIVGRGLLREVIGAYAGTAAIDVRLGQAPNGKPFLVRDPSVPPIDFNLSHSEESALLAVTGGARVGVDLEVVRELPEYEDIARQNFAPGEVHRLLSLPESQRLDAFFAIWAHKEAYVKALGGGLSIALDGFEVQPAPSGAAALRSSGPDGEYLRGWALRGFRPQTAAWGAVAVQAAEPICQFFRHI